MTLLHTQHESDELEDGPGTAFHLILCRDDRIVFHDRYENAALRLRTAVSILTASDLLIGTITAERASRIHEVHHAHVSQWQKEPDAVINRIAKLLRDWGVQLYVSTTKEKPIFFPTADGSSAEQPQTSLFSVITDYGSGLVTAEHFPTRRARTTSLVDRAEHFFAAPGQIPEIVLADDQRLAALVAAFLMPATVSLTESVLDDGGTVYRPIEADHTNS